MLALVCSQTVLPQSQWCTRSGTSKRRRAAAGHSPARTCAKSCTLVLIGMHWMPVRAKSSARGTAAKSASSMPVGAVVAVADRIGEQPLVRVEQAEIDAPAVDADAAERLQRHDLLSRGRREAFLDRARQRREGPALVSVDAPQLVREAVQLVQRERSVAQVTQHHAPAAGAEVDREVAALAHRRPHTIPEPWPAIAGRSRAFSAR